MSPHQSEMFFRLPELTALVAGYLTGPELYSAILVCRQWNMALIPFLWHTVDTDLYGWPSILRSHDLHGLSESGKDEGWVRLVFQKYGPFISCLRTRWKVIIIAAFSESACTQLTTLSTFKLGQSHTIQEEAELQRALIASLEETFGSLLMAFRPAFRTDYPIISPLFVGMMEPSKARFRTLDRQRQNWIAAQSLWLLIRQNIGLHTIRLDWDLEDMCSLTSLDFLYDGILRMLPRLVSLESHMIPMDLERLLECVPSLQSYRTLQSMDVESFGSSGGGAEYDHFRELGIPGVLTCQSLARLLGKFPNMQRLQIEALQASDVAYSAGKINNSEGENESGGLWSACQGLETLRAQIVGVDRLSYLQQLTLNRLALTRPAEGQMSERERAAVDRQHESHKQQRQILEQLSVLTRLKSGLDQLSTLKELRVFGFEGVDHRIGKPELVWMAANWPRLKVMGGLQEGWSTATVVDMRRDELREHMQRLRPDVNHRSLSTTQ
ncbi:hypothetical protein BGZ97_006513 [Linnemannia gamsii]|uniref:F-box domain-containing protein n=1 Tax=Linnemannia gamsii TaxID=64522 RepID=A0A9P6QU16_9FUNG|nr:hypothetical protein BGZ97_006513 [Linnemannia gamsii]